MISCEIIIFYAPKYDSNASGKFLMLTLCLYKADIRRKHGKILKEPSSVSLRLLSLRFLVLLLAPPDCQLPSPSVITCSGEDRGYNLDQWFGVPLDYNLYS